jgi:HEAT repeat protein
MINPDHFAVTLARAAHLFRTSPDIPQRKTTLRALVALTKLGSITVSVREGELVVEGNPVSPALPLIRDLTDLLQDHGVTTVSFSQGAPPSEVLNFLKRLASDPDADLVAELAEFIADEWGGTGVFVSLDVAAESESAANGRESGETAISPPMTSLATAMRRLAAAPSGDDVLDRLNDVGEEIRDAFEADRLEEAVQAVSAVIALEERARSDHVRRYYGIVLRRSLTRGILQRVTRMLNDSRFGDAASRVLRRAGPDGTKVLVDQINSLPTVEERRTAFGSLRSVREGYHLMVSMLRHPDWYVVRNAAWLIGELGIGQVVPELVLALEHKDLRVRQAAAVALAKVAKPQALEHLARIVTQGDVRLRSLVLSAVQGPHAAGLVRPLTTALEQEKDSALAGEYLRALGRIGTPDAVRALMNTAQSGRWFRARKPKPIRLAAIEALRELGGATAIDTLEALVRDRDRDVQEAARSALAEIRGSEDEGAARV